MEPLGERILVKQIIVENKSESGLILPTSIANEVNTYEAEVLECGLGTNEVKMVIEKGMKVLCPKGYGIEWKYGKQDCVIIRQSDVIAIL